MSGGGVDVWPSGVERIELDEIDSTNAEAARLGRAGRAGPLWIRARRQTAGRGRRGRAWALPSGNLAASLLIRPYDFRPRADLAEAATLSFAASLAVADAAAQFAAAADLSLKWPNDVLLMGRKLAGLLLEGEGAGPGAWLVIGIGVNIAEAPNPAQLEGRALPPIALSERAPGVTADALFPALAAAMAARLAQWAETGFAELRRDWLAKAARLGQPILARLEGETVEGRFLDVDPDGALVVETRSGQRRIAAADIYFPAR